MGNRGGNEGWEKYSQDQNIKIIIIKIITTLEKLRRNAEKNIKECKNLAKSQNITAGNQ